MANGIDPMAQLFDPQLMAQYRALLEPPQEAKRAAGMDALLALGLGLLGNRSPHLGVALGNAGVGAMGAHRYALDSARQNRMGEIQGAMGLRKLQKDMEQEARMKELVGQIEDPRERIFAEADFPGYIKAKMEGMKPTDLQREAQLGGLAPNELSDAVRMKFGLKPKAELPQVESGFFVDRANRAVTPIPEMQGFMLSRSAAGAPRTLVDARRFEETEEAKNVGKWLGETYGKVQQSGLEARGKVARYNRLEQLLQGVETGKLTPALTEVAAVADSVGIRIDPALDAKQAIQSISNELALQLRNPSGGAGMPGAMSDSDRQFLVNMTAGLGKTPGANKLIIESHKKLAQRDIEVANMARKYRQQNGRLDDGFFEELQKFSDATPMFPRQEAKGSIWTVEGQRGTSKTGKPIVFRGGKWEYE